MNYRHYKGRVYKFLHLAVMEKTKEPVVVYEREGVVWVRPAGEFFGSVMLKRPGGSTEHGEVVTERPRFTPEPEDT